MIPGRSLRFLASRGDAAGARTVLVVQSGAPEVLEQVVQSTRDSFPGAAICVLLQRNMRARVRALEGVEYLENTGSKRALLEQLRARRFDVAVVLYTNEPGYWKLKLLPFLVGARHVFAVNEHLGRFPISLRAGGALARHVSWRAGGNGGSRTDALLGFGKTAAGHAASHVVAAWLLAYERIASARAAKRGAPRWKTPPADR